MMFTAKLKESAYAWQARLTPFAGQARAFWKLRSPREQAFLLAGALLLIAVLLWVLALRPAMQTIQSAQQRLPVLQAQAAQLAAVILEAKALGDSRRGVMPAGDTEQALLNSLRTAGLDTVSVLGRPTNVDPAQMQWRVELANAPAGRVMEWLANLPFMVQTQTQLVDLARSNVDGRDRPGQLSGVVVLAIQQAKAS